MTQEQRETTGLVARRILDFALNQPVRNLWLVISGLETVCRTYESDPNASRAILRQCLEPEHVLQHGHEELFRLAPEIERLIPLDPQVVEEIYCAAFTLMDDSEESTSMGGSRILSLSSTRRQDFYMARFALAERYGKFMEQAPEYALRALIAAFRTYPSDRYSYSTIATAQTESFDFNGKHARLKSDRSEIWADNGGYGNHEEPRKMLDIFEHFLDQIAADANNEDKRKKLIEVLILENETAALWRKVLQVAEKHPQTFGLEICPLAWAIPILTCDDTSPPVGDYLKAAFRYFTSADRSRVEQAILSLFELADEEGRRHAERTRNRLLRCLEEQSMVTEEARTLLMEIKQAEAVPPNEPRFHHPVFSSRPFTDEDLLKENNVPVEDTANRHLLKLTEPVKIFASSYFNERPELPSVHEIIPALQSLHAALVGSESEGCHERTCILAWGYLANACKTVTKCESFNCEDNNAPFIKTTLIEAAHYSDPPITAYQDWDGRSWGSPAARIDAAEGIMRLTEKASCAGEELFEMVEHLANDPVPPVRFMIARGLTLLYQSNPKLMWKLFDNFSQFENDNGVLSGFVANGLRNLAFYDADRVAPLVRIIFDRVSGDDQASETRQCCTDIFTGLYIWQNQIVCEETLQMIINDPVKFNTEAHRIAFNLRAQLNLGSTESPNAEHNKVRVKSFTILQQLLTSTLNQAKELNSKYAKDLPFSSWSEPDQKKASDLAHLADSIGMQIYFASGAFQDNDTEDPVPRGVLEQTRFWKHARPILELLAEFEYAGLVHHLIQTLEYLLPFDPLEIFLLIGKVLKKGKEGGYQYESMAITLIVKIIEQFITEYPQYLQESEACRRTLIEILDIFVDAGWPAARRLTYRLEEIFR